MPLKLLVVLTVGAWSMAATAQRANPLPALATRIDRAQSQIESVESVRAIKRLQLAYGHYSEFGLWNDFADLFTDDATTNYSQGVHGKAEVQKLFVEQLGRGKLGLSDGRIYPHILFQPVVTLSPDGRSAKGRWRILAMLGGYGGSATWYSGVYENQYVLDHGAWKISVLNSVPKVTAAYTAAGWKDSGAHIPFHYTLSSVSTQIADTESQTAKPSPGATPSLKSLADHVNQLARRAARLNDQAAVTNLQDMYGYAMDRKRWDQVADLFAGDGTLELGLQGVYAGKASIRHALNQFGPHGSDAVETGGKRGGELNDHVYLQTIVSVAPDGHTAKARGVELIMSSAGSTAPGGELSEGVFENAFVKQDSAWKIQSVHFYPRMIVDAKSGWAESAKPAPGPSKEFPPDRPPSVAYEIYPKFVVTPFHFDNPVTGKPPQYPEAVLATTSTVPTAAPPARVPAIRNTAGLEVAVAELERSLTMAKAYDAAENLIGAYGYYLDESPADAAGLFVQPNSSTISQSSIFVNQILQPVIDLAPDGKSAKIRVRLLDLGGISGGPGYWTAGSMEGQIILEQNKWRFQNARSVSDWSAPYPGGWANIP